MSALDSTSQSCFGLRATALSFLVFGLFITTSFGQRNLTDIPKPDPVMELKAMEVAEGFEVNLFASDPDIAKPIHMNWDAQGRLWVASSKNYPQLKPGAKPSDEIVVLEDTNGDGKADKKTVFADDLLIPTGILPGDGGVYVANSTELLHLADTDGDGRADQRRTILSGFGTEDTHHLLHTLHWRPDGRMAFNQSIYIHSHIETPYGVKHLDGGGIWHFDAQTSRLEIFCKGFVNPWGHAISPFGQSFVTDGAYFEGINYAFPGSTFATSPGATRWLSGLNPGSPKHCGLTFVSGEAMPESMQGVLVTNDFRGQRVCRFRVERSGSGYRSVQLPELIRSSHIAFRPIDAKMGPDGGLYIADWYNPIIQHGEVDFRDPRRDTEHGRIWRVVAKNQQTTPRIDFEKLDDRQLMQQLSSPSWERRGFARREITRRGQAGTMSDQLVGVDTPSVEAEALWLALSAKDEDRIEQLLEQYRKHLAPQIRALAFRIIGERNGQLKNSEQWLLAALSDTDDQVILEAICGLHRIGSLAATKGILAQSKREGIDQNLSYAIWNALKTTESTWLPALEDGRLELNSISEFKALADAATNPQVGSLLLQQIGRLDPQQQQAAYAAIAAKADSSTLTQITSQVLSNGNAALQSGKAEELTKSTAVLTELATQLQQRNLKLQSLQRIIAEELRTQRSKQQSAAAAKAGWLTAVARLAEQVELTKVEDSLTGLLTLAEEQETPGLASAVLAALIKQGSSGRQKIRELANNNESSLQQAAGNALARFDPSAAIRLGAKLSRNENDNISRRGIAIISAILNTKNGARKLQEILGQTSSGNWPAANARQLLAAVKASSQSNPALENLIKSVTGLDNSGWEFSEEFAAELIQLATTSGDPANGEAVYRRNKLQCVQCHAIGESGNNIGPNLVSLGASSTPEYIVESLLAPAAKVKEGYQTLNAITEDGEVVSGLQKSKTEETLELQLADGKIRKLSLDSIEALREGKSLMPAGLLDELSKQELTDLVAFMLKLGKDSAYTVDTRSWVRNAQTLIWTGPANGRLNRTSLDTVATDEPTLKWRTIPSRVDGSLAIEECDPYQPHRQTPPTVFVKFWINCEQAGEVQIRLPQLQSTSFWLDGKPSPTPSPTERIELSTGNHAVVLGVQPGDVVEPFGCEVISPQGSSARVSLSATAP